MAARPALSSCLAARSGLTYQTSLDPSRAESRIQAGPCLHAEGRTRLAQTVGGGSLCTGKTLSSDAKEFQMWPPANRSPSTVGGRSGCHKKAHKEQETGPLPTRPVHPKLSTPATGSEQFANSWGRLSRAPRCYWPTADWRCIAWDRPVSASRSEGSPVGC